MGMRRNPEAMRAAIEQESPREMLRSHVDALLHTVNKEVDRMVAVSNQRIDALHETPPPISLIRMQEKFVRLLPWLMGIALAGKLEQMAHPVDSRFDKRQEAAEMLADDGITDERLAAYTPGLSEAVYRSVAPIEYQTTWDILKQIPEHLIFGHEDTEVAVTMDPNNALDKTHVRYRSTDLPEVEDAWRFYLGLPQEHGTFGVSEFRPAKSSDDVYYYKINNFAEKYFAHRRIGVYDGEEFWTGYDTSAPHFKPIKELLSKIDNPDLPSEFNTKDSVRADDTMYVMGNFVLSRGQDERGSFISYYDRWDLGPSIEGENGLIGKPFEIYDRIYYNPVTFEPTAPSST